MSNGTVHVLVIVEDEQFGYDSAGGGPVMQDYVYDMRTSRLRKFVDTKPLDPMQVLLHAQPWRRLHELDKGAIVAAINVELEKANAAFVQRRLDEPAWPRFRETPRHSCPLCAAGIPARRVRILSPHDMALLRIMFLVQQALTDELRRPRYRGSDNPLAGHCYVASEALWHLGARDLGYYPMVARDEYGDTHWWLERDDMTRLDPTLGQFRDGRVPPYGAGRRCGFLTTGPSKRAKIVVERVPLRLRDPGPFAELRADLPIQQSEGAAP